MKSLLNAPGSMLLKLRRDGPLSNFAFNFNLRRYSGVCTKSCGSGRSPQVDPMKPRLKAPGTKRLKVKYDDQLRSMLLQCCFQFELAALRSGHAGDCDKVCCAAVGGDLQPDGTCSDPTLQCAGVRKGRVRQCRVPLSNPR